MPGIVSVVSASVVIGAATVPVAAPATVSPAAAAAAHHGSYCQPGSEGKDTCGHNVSRGVGGNDVGISVNNCGIVLRDIDNLRVGRLDDDDLRRRLGDGDLR